MKNLNSARVNVMVSDMGRAIEFYVNTLGLELLQRYGNHYAELDAKGVMIALHPSNERVVMGNNISIGLGVLNFDETIQNLEKAGIKFSHEKGGYIRLAHFTDPDGNALFLAENKKHTMNQIFQTYRPDGFGTVASYLFVSNPDELIDFLVNAFYAEEINLSVNPETGEIGNVILKIGDTCFMISQARSPFNGMRTAHYLYVDDVDEIHERALQHGALEEFKPMDMDYNDRQSGIIDPSGNYWWISKRLVKKGYEE